MFEMSVNQQKKAFIIKVGGYFQENEAQAFLDTYRKNVASFRPSETNLVLIADELSTSKEEMIPVLENLIGMYKATGFKMNYSTNPKSAIAKSQLKKVAEKCGMKVTFDNTLEDILKKL